MWLIFLTVFLNFPWTLSLLKEAEIHAEQREFELNRRRQMGLSASHHSLDNIEFDNKEDDQHDQRLLSQFGIWFLVCNPSVCQYQEGVGKDVHSSLILFLCVCFTSPGKSVHPQREHAHGEPGSTGQHGFPVVSLHCLHDGWWSRKPGGKAEATVCHKMAEDCVWSALWCHGHVSAAQTCRICQSKKKKTGKNYNQDYRSSKVKHLRTDHLFLHASS